MILACKNFMNVITKISNLRVDGNFSASIISVFIIIFRLQERVSHTRPPKGQARTKLSGKRIAGDSTTLKLNFATDAN